MAYDDLRAASYDERHSWAFAQVPTIVDSVVRLLDRVDGGSGRVLELGIGTGRLAIPLSQRGVDVAGIDNSPPMVERLRTKAGGKGIPVAIGSFERPDQLVDGPFSLAYLAYNSLFELTSQQAQVRCFDGVSQLLEPTGLFVLEALAPDLTRLEQSMAVTALDPDRVVIQATRHDPASQVVTGNDVELTARGPRLSPWTIRYASVAEIDLMAQLAGLELVERWGSWDGGAFSAATTTHVSVYGHRSPPAPSAS